MVEKTDFAQMLIKNKELPFPVLKKVVPTSISNNHFCKRIGKQKNIWASAIIHKKARKGDCLGKMDEIEKEKDDEEFELSDYVEHDKKYFFVRLAKIGCKLCSYKGKFIVQHYRMSHPESEVLISRISPDIAEVLIQDAIRNREEYDKDHPKLEKVKCNFKCPFCLMRIKDTTNTYYNHISSHTGEYCFHCNHCSYWTYSHINIHSHLNQMHHKIQKTEYKTVYLNPKISKYVFGYICSKCNFVQLIRATVEEHAMVYHPGMPEIHKVNLGALLHGDIVDEDYMNEIPCTENHSNLNYCNAVTSLPGEAHNHNLKIPAEVKEASNLLVQMEELEDINIKIEPKKLDDDLHPIEPTTFVCQPDLDIKQDSESDRSEMLEWINDNTRNAKTSASDQLQVKLVTEIVEETEKNQRNNKEPKNLIEEMEILNEDVQLEKVKKSLDMIEIGPISVINEFNVFTFQCKIQNCNYSSNDKNAFAIHCEIIHKDFVYIFSAGKCNICSIKFEYKGKFVTVYDIYLHIVTIHKDFFEPKSLVAEDKEEEMRVITSIQLLTPKLKQLVSTSENGAKCASMLTDIPMTDIEKQNRKCPKAVAVMMRSPLLNALYKCPKYDCSFATMLPLSFKEHFVAHYSIVMDTLVPCLYCDYKVSCNSYVTHLEVRHGHCIFGCGDCFYRTTNSYFIMMHRELAHPNTEFNILQLVAVTSNKVSTNTTLANLLALVPPYNCKDDGFLSCPFKTLYFDEYLNHVEATHQVNGFGAFSSELEPQREVVMEGWLVKEVGPFQCRYCKKATVTHQEMGRHQAVFHAQEQCLFYYRKFVPSDTVIIPEQVNLEDPSFINHVIHLPDQINLCNFKLMDGLPFSTSTKLTSWDSAVSLPFLPPPAKDTETDSDQSSVSLEEPEVLSALVNDEACLREESDPLCLDEQPEDGNIHNDVTVTDSKLQCKWKGCHQTYHSQRVLVNHIKKNHIRSQKGEEFTCSWINCPRNSKPFTIRRCLSRHMSVHSREKPCKSAFQSCNETFSQLKILKNHEREHAVERTYSCQFSNCFKRFSTSSYRNKHQRLHYYTEVYACQVTDCTRKYTDPSNLWRHMKHHTIDEQREAKWKSIEILEKVDDLILKKSSNSLDEDKLQRTFQCKWKSCYQTYHSQTALVKHIENNHVVLQIEKFTCFWIDCPRNSKPFTRRWSLSKHMSVHSGEKPYKCSVQDCNKAFAQLSSLHIHQRSHTGERPYLCQFPNCLKSFVCSSKRINHERKHFNAKPYACQVIGCSEKYAKMGNLRKHEEKHTINEKLEAKQKENDFIIYHT